MPYRASLGSETFHFDKLHEYESLCLECLAHDYTHGTIVFNAFIFCQRECPPRCAPSPVPINALPFHLPS